MSEWLQMSLREACDVGGGDIQTGPFGSQLHAADYIPEGIPSVMPKNIGDNRINPESIARISSEDAQRLAKYRLRPGDIVYPRRGDVGKRALVRKENDGWLCGTGCLRVRLGDKTPHDARFISYSLATEQSREWIVRHAVGATMPNLNTSILGALPLKLPPFAVQQAIANVLAALDDKIATNTEIAATVDELLATEFVGLGVDVDPNAGNSIRLDELVELNPSVPRPSEEEPVYVDMQKLPVTGMSISAWSHRAVRGGVRFQNGDTLLARITPCLQNRKTGFVDFLDHDQVGVGSTEYIVLRSRPGIPHEFSYFLGVSGRFRTFAIRHMVGTSGRQRVAASDLANFILPAPKPSALEVFGKKARTLFALVKAQRDESRTLATIRDALLSELMAGKLRLKDAEKAVEEVV